MKLRSEVHAFFVHIERKLCFVLNIYNKSWKYEDFCLIINARN